MCNASQSQVCSRCHSSRYCSPNCQQADWPIHKLLCRTYSNFSQSRPSPDHALAIIFPPSKPNPALFWLHCPWTDDVEEGYPRHRSPEICELLGDNTSAAFECIQDNPVLNRKLRNSISIWYRDTFLIDGSQPNKSIATNTITTIDLVHDWRGPIIAYGNFGPGLESTECRDLDLVDFRHIVDFFNTIRSEATVEGQRFYGEKVKGVKINCHGDQKVFGAPPFEAVEVPHTHPIFTIYHRDKSEIAKRIGLPILARQYPPNRAWAKEETWGIFGHESPFNNEPATYLHLSCDSAPSVPNSLGWGWAPQKWQSSVGSVIVAREDKKPLLPLHMEALCRYCQFEIFPLFSHSNGGYAPEKANA